VRAADRRHWFARPPYRTLQVRINGIGETEMAGIYWLGALLVGLVLGLVAVAMLIIEYTGYAIGVAATVVAGTVTSRLPGRHAA
jgi:hypothetical protein